MASVARVALNEPFMCVNLYCLQNAGAIWQVQSITDLLQVSERDAGGIAISLGIDGTEFADQYLQVCMSCYTAPQPVYLLLYMMTGTSCLNDLSFDLRLNLPFATTAMAFSHGAELPAGWRNRLTLGFEEESSRHSMHLSQGRQMLRV